MRKISRKGGQTFLIMNLTMENHLSYSLNMESTQVIWVSKHVISAMALPQVLQTFGESFQNLEVHTCTDSASLPVFWSNGK